MLPVGRPHRRTFRPLPDNNSTTTVRRLIVREESWDVGGGFSITRSRRWAADVLMVEIYQDGLCGRGEAVPYRRRSERLRTVAAHIEKLRDRIQTASFTRNTLQGALPPGAARNALDCALWDLEAKRKGIPVWKLAGLPEPKPLVTAYTISLDKPAAMAAVAAEQRDRALLKLKLGGPDDLERVRAVRQAAPDAEIIVDALESWTPVMLSEYGGALHDLGVRLVEQPLPAGQDAALDTAGRAVALCADESVNDLRDLAAAARRYDYVNIKLDKAGGLTEAISMVHAAQQHGVAVLLGCMIGTSLAIAPAFLLGSLATIVDLDGPLLLSADREPSIQYDSDGTMHPPPPLWG